MGLTVQWKKHFYELNKKTRDVQPKHHHVLIHVEILDIVAKKHECDIKYECNIDNTIPVLL